MDRLTAAFIDLRSYEREDKRKRLNGAKLYSLRAGKPPYTFRPTNIHEGP